MCLSLSSQGQSLSVKASSSSSPSSSSLLLSPGNTLTLVCSVAADNLPALALEVTWLADGRDIITMERSGAPELWGLAHTPRRLDRLMSMASRELMAMPRNDGFSCIQSCSGQRDVSFAPPSAAAPPSEESLDPLRTHRPGQTEAC